MQDGIQHIDVHLRGSQHQFSLQDATLPHGYPPAALAQALASIPHSEVYWFGSRVWGNARSDSDFDLGIVLQANAQSKRQQRHALQTAKKLARAYSQYDHPNTSNIDMFVFQESTKPYAKVFVVRAIIQNMRRGIRVLP